MTPRRPAELPLTLAIAVPAGDVISGNGRDAWQATHRQTIALVARARAVVIAAGRPHIDRATRHVTIHYPDKRRRDAENYRPTVKALQDGMVRAGLLDDDDDEHVRDIGIMGAEPDAVPPPSMLRVAKYTRAFVFVFVFDEWPS